MRTVTGCVVTVVAAAAITAAAILTIHAAQGQPAPQDQPFQTQVNYVRVDMYPTKDGSPVTDLAATDVEILEDDVPQKVAQFEHVAIGGVRPQTSVRDPTTVDETRRAAQDPRARLFAGDYLIELTAPAERTLTAFRVLP